ncbi:hypothetical protein [Patiriisocius hiemis]|uniref:Uncharacterized protein n=1 Tax=Patiriisocius hiemis TaxID=3075604 RepID=A0ABU2YGH3_9FLAO|nr:hypothetical protein [Constantimarinum sp. W242]MDT0556153.1 hypothetical protein [Constantimarinum sp. W242]
MNTRTNFKYVEWRDTKGLHADSVNAISDLKFLKDELQFLKDLVAEHTLELIYGKPHEEAVRIGAELRTFDNRLKNLLKNLVIHSNNLQVLTDDIDVPNELQDYKNVHYKLMIEVMDFHSDVKNAKHKIFKMMSSMMKESKQKKMR